MIPIDLIVEKSAISIIWGNPTLGCNVLSDGKLNPIYWINFESSIIFVVSNIQEGFFITHKFPHNYKKI